jgi:hypothetical protein
MNNFCRIFLILGFARERELILGLSIRDFVNAAEGENNSV